MTRVLLAYANANGEDAAEQHFDRRTHLVLTLVAAGLFTWWLYFGGNCTRWLLSTYTWTPQAAVAYDAIVLLCVALPAWLALVYYDTDRTITVWPTRWRDVGVVPLLLLALMLAITLTPRIVMSLEALRPYSYIHYRIFIQDAEVAWGALLMTTLLGVTAEGVLYSVLTQRTLEGSIGRWPALFGQALIFQLAHAYLYRYGFDPYHFLCGFTFGLVFMRTRSLAAPTLAHVGHNLVHAAVLLVGVPL